MPRKRQLFVTLLLLIQFLWLSAANAALPPRYQNMKDLNVMVQYVKAHPKVLESLRAISLSNYTVTYGNNCQVKFQRLLIERPAGWAGPAAPLQFARDTCANGKNKANSK